MKPLHILVAFLALAASALFGIDTASAQATRTWVSGVGDDVNPCSRTAPCKTFAGAISKTASGGEINCLDPAGYGTVTITKSITIDCTGTFGSSLNSGGINGINVNDSASGSPNTIKVILRGITINGTGTTMGLNGIRFTSGASLVVEDVFIENQNTTTGAGISFQPTAAAKLVVNNTQVSRNSVGLLVSPTSGGSANVVVTNSVFVDSVSAAVKASDLGTTGIVNVALSGVSASASGIGIRAEGDTQVQVAANRVVASSNGTGLSALAPAVIRVGDSVVSGNTTGVAGNIRSYGNNQLDGNTTQGSTTPDTLKSVP